MILVRCHNPARLKSLLGAADVRTEQVTFNGPETDDTRVIVSVGGQGIDYTHCYVQQHYRIPIISCLPPELMWQSEKNRILILLALNKAAAIDNATATPYKVSNAQIFIPQTVSDAARALKDLVGEYLAVDIECIRETGDITCIGFAGRDSAVVIPLQHETQSYWSAQDEAEIWRVVASTLTTNCPKLFQNYIFDCMVLARHGVLVSGPLYDTMTLAHLIQPELPKGLADLARIYLYCEPWKGLTSWISNSTLWQYNGRDALYTQHIHAAQLAVLAPDATRTAFYTEHLVPLHSEVLRICTEGLNVDHAALKELSGRYAVEVAALRQRLVDAVKGLIPPKVTYTLRRGPVKPGATYCIKGPHVYEPAVIPDGIKMLKKLPHAVYEKKVLDREFNPSSPDQVKDMIRAFGDAVPTHKGKETTDELALKKLMFKTKRPIYRQLLEYREAYKILTTYCAVQLDPDGRLRSTVVVPGTVTSRFSSSQTPWGTGCNTQNIPKNFRHIIVPMQNYDVLMNLDFKQADPHVVAWLSGEQAMLDIMDAGGDLHAHTASALAGRNIILDPNYNKESNIERKLGKACNNALNYGMGALRLSNEIFKSLGLSISIPEAERMISSYFALYPSVKRWHRETEAAVYKTRRLETPSGRVRHFLGPLSYKLVQDALAYIPPTLVADALNRLWLLFNTRRGELRAKVIQQCHDSLLFSVHHADLDSARDLLLKCAKEVTFVVNGHERRFDIDLSVGPNWGQLK